MESQHSPESDATLLKAAIEAIAKDNLLPSSQWSGLMKLPAYAAGVQRFRELWAMHNGTRTQLEECDTCRMSLFNRLRRILDRVENGK